METLTTGNRQMLSFLLFFLIFVPVCLGELNGRPNVILILAEDLGYGDLACYGHPYARTPNLDRLAAEGTQFMRFYVTGMTCNPSRTGFMTSRSPASFPNYMADFGFKGVPTVTEFLKRAGYITGHYGKWHLGPDYSSGTFGIDDIQIIGPAMRHPEGKDSKVFKGAIDFIDSHKKSDKPFYLNVWAHIAHSPVKPAESLVSQLSNVSVDRGDFGHHMQETFDDSLRRNTKSNLDINMRNYLADIWSLDLQIGYLLRKLDETGLAENTVVVFTSDHGAAPPLGGMKTPEYMLGYAGGLRGGKHSFYEGGVRTPFIVRWPGQVPAGHVNDKSIISALDWLPTVCSLAGISVNPAMVEGENVLDVWLGSTRSRKNPLFWKLNVIKSQKVMLYKNWKLHIGRGNKGTTVLYDLDADPEEDIDVRWSYRNVSEAMESQLISWDTTLPTKYCKKRSGCKEELPFESKKKPKVIEAPPLLLSQTDTPTLWPSSLPSQLPLIFTPTQHPNEFTLNTTSEPVASSSESSTPTTAKDSSSKF